ncbi:MAG: hypothetical protein IJD51_00440 [Clostridia bacterium]|nr:hypothetical protein [Clostridia bacterium]
MENWQEVEDIELGFDPEMAYKKPPAYNYKLMREYVKEKNKLWSELTTEEIEQFRLQD